MSAEPFSFALLFSNQDEFQQEIGRLFGGRDHSTVLYSIRKVERRMELDADFRELTGLPVMAADDALHCAALGAALLLEDPALASRVSLNA